MKKLLVIIILTINFQYVRSQSSNIYPEKVKCKEKITISYNQTDTSAIIKGSENIYARLKINFQNGDEITKIIKLTKTKYNYSNSFIVPNLTSYIEVNFHTLTIEDKKAKKIIKIYDKNNVLVKGALFYNFKNFGTNINKDSILQIELNNHPNNFSVYGIRLMYAAPAPYSDDLENSLKKYKPILEKLYKKKKNRNNSGLLFSLCIAESKQKNIDRAKLYFSELIKNHTQLPLTSLAFRTFYYASYRTGNKNPIDEKLTKKIENIYKENPKSLVFLQNSYYFLSDTSISLALIEKTYKFAVNRDSLDYKNRINLSNNLYKQKKYKEAEKIITDNINFLLKSGIEYTWTSGNNSAVKSYLAQSYYVLAKIQKKTNNYNLALASVTTAINYITDHQLENFYISKYNQFKANIYFELNNFETC